MKKYILLILLGMFLAGSASAALVPCGQSCQQMSVDGKSCINPGTSESQPCQLCHLWQLFNNIINFVLYSLVVPGAALLFAYAGVLVLIAGGSADKVKKGRTIFTRTVFGLVIIFCSWLIIGTIINTLAGSSEAFNIIGAWNKFPPCP